MQHHACTYAHKLFNLVTNFNYILYIVPGIPENLFVNEINSTTILVSWDEPSITNGIITMYEILYSPGNHSVLNDNVTVISVTATVNTSYEIIISGLDHFTVYTVAVRAYTSIGGGNLTDTLSIFTDPFSKCNYNFTNVALSTVHKVNREYLESGYAHIWCIIF